jgi:hypothetical protein
MMAERRYYSYTTNLSWGGDTPTAEIDDIEVSYTVAWGSPEVGRFGPPEGYDPGSGDMVEDIRIEMIDGKLPNDYVTYEYVAGETFRKILAALEMDHEETMLEVAAEEGQGVGGYDRDERG